MPQMQAPFTIFSRRCAAPLLIPKRHRDRTEAAISAKKHRQITLQIFRVQPSQALRRLVNPTFGGRRQARLQPRKKLTCRTGLQSPANRAWLPVRSRPMPVTSKSWVFHRERQWKILTQVKFSSHPKFWHVKRPRCWQKEITMTGPRHIEGSSARSCVGATSRNCRLATTPGDRQSPSPPT